MTPPACCCIEGSVMVTCAVNDCPVHAAPVPAIDVERLARAIKKVGRWRKHEPGGIAECRPYAELLAAAYAAGEGQA